MTEETTDLLRRLAHAEAEIARLKARDAVAVRDPDSAAERIREVCHAEQETFVALYLDARQKVLAVRVVALGSVASVEVHPREVYRDAVRMAAHAIIIGHNHPSGVPEPSGADVDLTERLSKAGRILGIPLLDHIVVTTHKSVSLASLGLMT